MTTTRTTTEEDVDPTPSRRRLTRVLSSCRQRWAGRRVVLAVHRFNGGMKALAEELLLSGARIGAVIMNTEPRPGDPAAEQVWSCAEHGLSMSQRQFEEWLCALPAEVTAWLDGLDPGRSWEALGTTYSQFTELGGRPAYGRWRPEWAAWEDKTRVDALWQKTGIPAPAGIVCSIDDPTLIAKAAELDQGYGVMVAIDTTKDVLGSSQGLRWVRSRTELTVALRGLHGRTQRVRLAAFVPGVPCSLMGMVFTDGVAVFDPIEVITLHRPSTGELVYGGCSTFWRPPHAQRDQLREYARLVGQELAESLGYTGVFSVDGLLGKHGFAATELNPRHVSGIGVRPGWPEFPTRLLNRAVQEHLPEAEGVHWRDVQDAYREVVRRNPSASLWIELPLGLEVGPADTEQVAVVPVSAGTRTVDCAVRYRPQCGGAWILGAAGDVPYNGALGPVTAALAALFGVDGLAAFDQVDRRDTISG